MSAVAAVLPEVDLGRGLDIYSRAALAQGGRASTPAAVQAQASRRLHRAMASEHWILDPDPSRPWDNRIRVTV